MDLFLIFVKAFSVVPVAFMIWISWDQKANIKGDFYGIR